MTDEDDRMDRARRIREMREGTGDEQTDDSPDTNSVPNTDTDGGENGNGTGDTGGDDGRLQIPGADVEDVAVDVEDVAVDVEDVAVDVEDLAEQAGLHPDEGDHDDESGVADPVGMAAESADDVGTTAETRVLEFDLGSERYCLDIDHVEEIVERETVTRVPNTPDYVEGVVDLRGQITTILDPKVLLDIDGDGHKDLIVVFDPEEFEDQGAIGWVVDDVNQVMPVADDEVDESPVDADHVNGVVERDGEFVVWTDPDVAIDNAVG